MQVVALKTGFYAGQRRRTGAIFEMDIADLKKLPKWVKAAPNAHEARKEAAAAKKAETDKQIAGARAASGGTAAKAKVDSVAEQLAG